jgi:Flp pilus assembly pilin Flp
MNALLNRLQKLYSDKTGQGIAEYAVMLAVVLTLALAAIRTIGSHSDEVFRRIANAIQ